MANKAHKKEAFLFALEIEKQKIRITAKVE
jgi:hypothetical protein